MKRITILTFAVLFIMVLSVQSQDFPKLLDGYFAYNRFWGSVLIVQNDKVLFQKSYGFADMDKKIKNDANSIFKLCSVTKTMTSAAIMKLHDEGKLSIYDRVDKYFPGFIADDTKDIKIINLLNHTSGLTANISQRDDQGNGMVLPGKNPITKDSLIAKFKNTKLKYQPGTRFEYNNYAYTLLAYIIEQVSGLDYASYLNKELFKPANMSHAYYEPNLTCSSSVGYVGMGTSDIQPVPVGEEHPSWYMGAGAMYSTTTDLANFINAVFTNQFFSDKTTRLMLDTCVQSSFPGKEWALGWDKQKTDNVTCFGHSGNDNGFATRISYIPSKNISIVILSNLTRAIVNGAIQGANHTFVNEIADKIVNLINNKEVSYLPIPKEKANIKICSKYKLDDSHVMDVSMQNDSLFLSLDRNTLFDYIYNKEISDVSGNVAVCRTLTTSILSGILSDGFEKHATSEMQKIFQNDQFIGLVGAWKHITSQSGYFLSYTIYNKKTEPGNTTYFIACHYEKSEITMNVSFNDQGLIQGFFITSILPKCMIDKVNINTVGKDEYFVDGYKYGGYKDYRIKFDKTQQTLNFKTDGEEFTAVKKR